MTKTGLNSGRLRESTVEGIFYPAEQDDLEREVRRLLAEARTPPGDAHAIITPHAAFQYAGHLMAEAFQSASLREIDNVVILTPVHREDNAEIILPEFHSFATPLGEIPVNTNFVRKLADYGSPLKQSNIPHMEENAIEVQLPFIKIVFPEASIVPILMGNKKAAGVNNAKLLAACLAELLKPYTSTLFIISTNIDERRSGNRSSKAVERLIGLIGKRSKATDPVLTGATKFCGLQCIEVVMQLGSPCKAEILHSEHWNANSDSNPYRVGYIAISISMEG